MSNPTHDTKRDDLYANSPRRAVEAEIQEKIAGEVVLSPHPGRTLCKWREDLGVSQQVLARQLATVPSVISDYESERRASPGATFIRRYVEGLISVDATHGGRVVQRMGTRPHSDGILGMREFRVALTLREFAERIHARPVGSVGLDRDIHGFTLLDALRAILSIDASRFVELYGWTTLRALLFTNVRYGRSPMVAIRAHPLKPAAVVFLSPGRIDPLAVRLSEVENIPLLTSSLAPATVLERLEGA